MSYKSEFQANNVDLRNLIEIARNLPDKIDPETPVISVSGDGLITATANEISATQQMTVQAAKTVTPSTSEQTAVDAGVYTTGAVKVAAMPTATQATPTISVSAAGTITASATQTAGYVAAGTKSATHSLPTTKGGTVTPTTERQTVAAYGTYITGDVVVSGSANLVPEKIVSGVNIFGVTGTAEPAANLASELSTQDSLITQIMTSLEGKASASVIATDDGAGNVTITTTGAGEISVG